MGAKRNLTLVVIAGVGVGFPLAGCGATDSEGARDAAQRLYVAYSDDDGAAACATLSDDTRKQLVEDEQKPCPEAVLELDLSGTATVGAEAYVTEAKVETDGGDSVFLEETGDGWRVTAAGCRPAPGREAPYDCEVES
ncbi:MAG TPA: hypothetical protein VEW67_06815 [Thermoleophilaceae bacterium]|nr:hypothetical protein [Thermoleophilaceae bacterium]